MTAGAVGLNANITTADGPKDANIVTVRELSERKLDALWNPLYVICGSAQNYVDKNGITWVPDVIYAKGGKVGTSTTIANPLAAIERYWDVVTPNYSGEQIRVTALGVYTITIYLAELYYNQAGKRLFSITVGDQSLQNVLLYNIDLYALYGYGSLQAYNIDVTVTTGVINIWVVKGPADNPKISAFSVIYKASQSTVSPTILPSTIPTGLPTLMPTRSPSTQLPSPLPTSRPSNSPTIVPSVIKSASPTFAPVSVPTTTMSVIPTSTPTAPLSTPPTRRPTSALPSLSPSTVTPTSSSLPSKEPSSITTGGPTSSAPSVSATSKPSSAFPTIVPTAAPSTIKPTSTPSRFPSTLSTTAPSSATPSTIAPTIWQSIYVSCGVTASFVDAQGRTWVPDAPLYAKGGLVSRSADIANPIAATERYWSA
eukprot:gene33135-42855_t